MEIKFEIYEITHMKTLEVKTYARPITPTFDSLLESQQWSDANVLGMLMLRFGPQVTHPNIGDIVTVSF